MHSSSGLGNEMHAATCSHACSEMTFSFSEGHRHATCHFTCSCLLPEVFSMHINYMLQCICLHVYAHCMHVALDMKSVNIIPKKF